MGSEVTLYEQFPGAEQLDLSGCLRATHRQAEVLAQAGTTIKKNLEALGYGE